MAKIARALQKIFGSAAGTNQIAQFGSLAASAPAFSTDPVAIQSFSNYLTGWYGAILGGNSPAIEDMNALCYLYAYQLAYIMQAGIPEWNASTVYYIGSKVTGVISGIGTGVVYTSLTDNNSNDNPFNGTVFDTTNWASGSASNVISVATGASPRSVSAAENNAVFLANSASGAIQFVMPTAVKGFRFTVIDVGGQAATNALTVKSASGSKINNRVASTSPFICGTNYGQWAFVSDGTDWFLSTDACGDLKVVSQPVLTNFPSSGVYGDLGSLSLGPGRWLITFSLQFTPNGSNTSVWSTGISQNSGMIGSGLIAGDNSLAVAGGGTIATTLNGALTIADYDTGLLTGAANVFYAKVFAQYATATPQYQGRMTAKKISS